MAESTAVVELEPEADLDQIPTPTRSPGWLRRSRNGLMAGGRWLGFALEWCLGATTLLGGLALLAVVPVAQLLSLGYLLDAAGRVARGGRLRDAAIGVRPAARVGSIVVGCWLGLLPARFVASLAASAAWIDPGGPTARAWRIGSSVVIALTLTHLLASVARGGRLRHFAWPPGSILWLARGVRRGGGSLYVSTRDAACDGVCDLRLWHYFRLGGLGFVGSMVWLAVPVALLTLGRRVPALGVVGGVALGVVATVLPFLQLRFAAEGRFRAIFEAGAVRDRFRRAPWAFAFAFLLLVAATIPLYLLKIEMMPREFACLSSLVFVGFLFPARVACGWAYARGGSRVARTHWFWRASGRIALLPGAVVYALVVFFAQYTSWVGGWSLFGQHAFLIPVPFLGY